MPGIIIFIILAVVLAGLAAAGFLAVRRIEKGPGGKVRDVDEEKLKEWAAAADSHGSARAAASSGPRSETLDRIRGLGRQAVAAAEGEMAVKAACRSLEEYKAFDAQAWFRSHMDETDAAFWAGLSDATARAWRGIRDELDAAGAEVESEKDPAVRQACLSELAGLAEKLSGDLAVRYSYDDGATGRKYAYVQYVPRDRLLAAAGRDPDGTDDPDRDPVLRNRIMSETGYRCRRCGRSALSGAAMRVWPDGGGGHECLCDGCRS